MHVENILGVHNSKKKKKKKKNPTVSDYARQYISLSTSTPYFIVYKTKAFLYGGYLSTYTKLDS
jgi:hypothetical protein